MNNDALHPLQLDFEGSQQRKNDLLGLPSLAVHWLQPLLGTPFGHEGDAIAPLFLGAVHRRIGPLQ